MSHSAYCLEFYKCKFSKYSITKLNTPKQTLNELGLYIPCITKLGLCSFFTAHDNVTMSIQHKIELNSSKLFFNNFFKKFFEEVLEGLHW